MGLINTAVEDGVLDLISEDGFGAVLEIDGSDVEAILTPDRGQTLAASMQGLGVERYRLICRKADCEPVAGQELVIDDITWTVVSVNLKSLISDISLERYL